MSSPSDQIMEFMFPVTVTSAATRLEVLAPALVAGHPHRGTRL